MNKNVLNFIYYSSNKLDITKYEIIDTKIPKEFTGFKIALLSDFHSNYNIKHKLIDSIYAENPDAVFITGDMISKYENRYNVFFSLIQSIKNNFSIYYIYGNHEKRLDKKYRNIILNYLVKNNVKIINNKKINLYKNKESISIIGIDIDSKYYRTDFSNREYYLNQYICKYLKLCDKNKFNMALIHNPLFFEQYSKYNIDLIFSGHVHGGMIQLPFLGALLSPERKFFPKYYQGIYEKNSTKMIVSRGLGHSRPGIRIMNNPELIFITLKSICKKQ